MFPFMAFVCMQGKGDMRTFWLTGIKSQTAKALATASTATTTVRTEKESSAGGGISLSNLSPLTTMEDSNSRLTQQTPKFVDKKLFDLIEALPKNNQDE